MIQAVADLLGMTPDQILAERQAGKSLAAIAAERGVDQSTLVQTITGAMIPRIQQFVSQMITREGFGPREGQNRGPQAGGQRGADLRQRLLQPIADLLNMTPDQIVAERRAGKSLADVAAERGVDQATLLQAVTVTAKARLDEQVAAGNLTQERADALYQRIQQAAPGMITNSGPAFGARGPDGRRGPDRGGPRRGPAAPQQPSQ
jgi:lambda repressor-like predicted transcriptional regulator